MHFSVLPWILYAIVESRHDAHTEKGMFRASVPSGVSTGIHKAVEIRWWQTLLGNAVFTSFVLFAHHRRIFLLQIFYRNINHVR